MADYRLERLIIQCFEKHRPSSGDEYTVMRWLEREGYPYNIIWVKGALLDLYLAGRLEGDQFGYYSLPS